ncbi:hypothetical protein O181_007476 [Austropuccinia psidii MF-1]|uniref:Uncharacterized protein n=1 Tax=Austropuccinia psidii MF-1 TaxID=1389203 RepID=A0A9Q3BKW3_9BASI|nr:hypothetical protein [Austropuccinia psidii MF-1]
MDRVSPMEEGEPSRRGGPKRGLGEAENEEGEDSVRQKGSEETEVETALVGAPECYEAPNIALFDQSSLSQDDGENDPIHGKTHSTSFSQGNFKSPSIQDSINEGTSLFLWYSSP